MSYSFVKQNIRKGVYILYSHINDYRYQNHHGILVGRHFNNDALIILQLT